MKGDVTVEITCLLPERLLRRALSMGARYSQIRRPDERTLTVVCDPVSADITLKLCERYALPARVLKRRGRSAVGLFIRRRITLFAGVALGLALCWLFLSRVWLIDIAFSGEAAALGDRAALEQTLGSLNIAPGISRALDTALLSQQLQASAGTYSYVGAHLQGIRLLIEAVPEVPAPSVYDVEAARDLVADRDGIVVSAVARSGELCVSPGDAVRRGQVLIRGEEKLTGEEMRPIAALGEVIVRAWYAGEAEIPLVRARFERTGRTAVGVRLVALDWDWPIVDAEEYADQEIGVERLPVGGLFVPVEIERTTYRETRRTTAQTDPERARALLEALAFADASFKLSREGPETFEITGSWIDYETSGSAMRARAVYEIHTDAAVTRDVLLQGG